MAAKLTEEYMYYYAQVVFLPLMLITSFALFQYLFITYYCRRWEPRGMLLLITAFLGFIVLVPLAHPSEEMVHHLNDISEACSTLTFLVQITIIGRDSNKKVKIRSVRNLTLLAEVLVTAELGVIFLDLIEVFNPHIGSTVSKEVNQAIEDASLVFIFVFRFYYLGLIKGFRTVLTTKKVELFVYFLFLTHEYPFLALEEATHVTWEFVQGIYHRLIVAACIWMTVKNKMKNGKLQSVTARDSQHTSQASMGRRKRGFESLVPDLKAVAIARGPSILFMFVSVVPMTKEKCARSAETLPYGVQYRFCWV